MALQRFAASQHLNSSERDLLRVLRSVGLMVRMTVHNFNVGRINVKYLKLKTWFEHVMTTQSGGQLIGGFVPGEPFARLCLKSYWAAFRVENPDHAIFQLHENNLDKLIPFAIHLDEGRGLRKSAVLVVHAQGIFGAATAPNFHQELDFRYQDHLGHEDMVDIMIRNQFHNARGCTFRSRMLYTFLPKNDYTKRSAAVYTGVLDKLREECTDLLEQGFTLPDGSQYFAAMIAVKGDAPALVKAGNLNRNFQCIPNPICWECMAGSVGVPFEDCRREPLYERTLYAERPWDIPGSLSMVPGIPDTPERVYHRDPFHIYKQSVGGSYVASCIVLLGELGYWNAENNTLADVMDRMYADFNHYVKHDSRGGVVPFMKHFTRTNLHYPRTHSFPYERPKGGDVMLLTRWMRFLVLNGPWLENSEGRPGSMIHNPLEQWHVPFLNDILKAANGVLAFFRIMHNQGLWLTRPQAMALGEGAFQFCEAYCSLAMGCHLRGLTRYSLVPSLHYFHHFYLDMKHSLRRQSAKYISSPSLANCEADEDYIGKISRISRHVHPSVTNGRTIDRFLARMHFVYNPDLL